MSQVVQLVGALLVLASFILVQLNRLNPADVRYLVANALGAGVLAGCAVAGRDWGFLVLEGTWSVVAFAGLVRMVLRIGATSST